MKRTSNMRWAKFAAAAAVGLGMLAGAASPALAFGLTIFLNGTLTPGRTGATINGVISCDFPGQTIVFTSVMVNQHAATAFSQGQTFTCDPSGSIPWTATAVIQNSKLLHKGNASALVMAYDGTVTQTAVAGVRLQ